MSGFALSEKLTEALHARVDLLGLDEASLVLASNMGTFKRAQKELKDTSLSANMTGDEGLLQINWSDGISCRFPAGSSIKKSSCSCGALEACRHRIRSVLWLKELRLEPKANDQHSTSADELKESPAAIADKTSSFVDPLSLPPAELQNYFGRGMFEKVKRSLRAEEFSFEVNETKREVVIRELGFRVCWPAGAGIDSGLCDCKKRDRCEHLLLALWMLRPDRDSVLAEEEGEEETSKADWGRFDFLLEELSINGLDSLSPAWGESAQTQVVELQQAGETTTARLLENVAREVEADRSRGGAFRPDRLRWLLASLWALRANRNADRSKPTRSRRDHWEGRDREFFSIGVSIDFSPRFVSARTLLLDVNDHVIYTAGTARPREDVNNLSVVTEWANILGSESASSLVGRRWLLSSAKGSDARTIRLGEGATLRPRNDISLSELVGGLEKLAHRALSQLANDWRNDFPSILSQRRPEFLIFAPSSTRQPIFEKREQRIRWELFDQTGELVPAMLYYAPEFHQAFERFLPFTSVATPRIIVGKISFSGQGFWIEPITVITQNRILWVMLGKEVTY